ncbi:MAG: glycosyltransferase family 4 protein [Nitrospira sp.]|nr:glycosyltransferase family 4 protein [Nitrospira sp.]MCP9442068.1 glycosyltransferase family 4 protein [Nitrospira sp.]
MNIIMTESSGAIGGQELAVLLYAEGLRARGHDLSLIVEPGSPIHRMAEARHIPVVTISMRRAHYASAILAIRTLLARTCPAIVHTNSSRDTWTASLAARLIRARPKIVRSRHISVPLNNNLATRVLYRRLCDFVIVTGGELTRQALIERDGLDPRRVDAFPIGIDVARFCPGMPASDLRRTLGIPNHHRLIGIVSYLRAYKGHRYFVEAAARVLSTIKDVTFVIAGEGPEESNLRTQIAELGLTDRIVLLGFCQDEVDVMRSLDVFVLPSVEADTIPQALMQALAVGLPVISTVFGSIPDVVKHGETGLLAAPRDAASLAEHMITMLRDESLRKRLGANGRRLVENRYSLDRMLDRLESVYERVVNASSYPSEPTDSVSDQVPEHKAE